MSFRLGPPRVCRMVLGILAVLSGAAMIPLALLARPAGSLALGNLAIAAVIGVPCAAVGWLVARRQPGNPLGWLFLVIAVCLFLSTDGGAYAAFSYLLGRHLPFGPVGLVLDDIWGPTLVLFTLVSALPAAGYRRPLAVGVAGLRRGVYGVPGRHGGGDGQRAGRAPPPGGLRLAGWPPWIIHPAGSMPSRVLSPSLSPACPLRSLPGRR